MTQVAIASPGGIIEAFGITARGRAIPDARRHPELLIARCWLPRQGLRKSIPFFAFRDTLPPSLPTALRFYPIIPFTFQLPFLVVYAVSSQASYIQPIIQSFIFILIPSPSILPFLLVHHSCPLRVLLFSSSSSRSTATCFCSPCVLSSFRSRFSRSRCFLPSIPRHRLHASHVHYVQIVVYTVGYRSRSSPPGCPPSRHTCTYCYMTYDGTGKDRIAYTMSIAYGVILCFMLHGSLTGLETP